MLNVVNLLSMSKDAHGQVDRTLVDQEACASSACKHIPSVHSLCPLGEMRADAHAASQRVHA